MLMLVVGTHVDIRSPAFRQGAGRGALAFLVVAALSIPIGIVASQGLGVGHSLLLVVLLANSSAAVAFPMIEERRVSGPAVAFLVAWIAIADSATVVLMPLGLRGTESLLGALVGDALVILAGIGFWLVGRQLRDRARVRDSVAQSRLRGWALQLRLSVLLLLVLGSVAEVSGGSILVAGFVAGMVVIRLGEPDRLALQVTGLASGFFVPIFFVLLGAELDLRALVTDPRAIALALILAIGAVAVHLVAALTLGRGLRVPSGLAASAQLGLPAAAAGLALSSHALSPAYAAALVAAGCLTLVPAAIGAARLERRSASE
jgi:Kef-type K+ transport system membrane component KefB